ncbi:hypothetical protein I2F17_09200 [Acinetobacter sp. B10A]|nr:hypothetical protein [Acinetobacter baretiae]
MSLKMKMRANQQRRQQRNIYAMQKDTNKPAGTTHFDAEHEVYYKQENGQWFYFEHVWGGFWKDTTVKVDLVEIEVCDEQI